MVEVYICSTSSKHLIRFEANIYAIENNLIIFFERLHARGEETQVKCLRI
jgi:hypothetical protein